MVPGRVSRSNKPRLHSGTLTSACMPGTRREVSAGPSNRGADPEKPVGVTSARLRNRCGDSAATRARNSEPSDTASASIGASTPSSAITSSMSRSASQYRRIV